MGRIFGTDGVRGVAGVELTVQLAMDLAVAAVPVLAPAAAASGPQAGGHWARPAAVIRRVFPGPPVCRGRTRSVVDALLRGPPPPPGAPSPPGPHSAKLAVSLPESHN